MSPRIIRRASNRPVEEMSSEDKEPLRSSSKTSAPQEQSATGLSETSKPHPLTNFGRYLSLPCGSVRIRSGRLRIDDAVFKEAQDRLRAAGKPEDPCGRCGCRRDGHLPGKTFSYAKSGGSSGNSKEIPVLAPWSCDCKYCLCFCVEFIEPFEGQPFVVCSCAPKPKVLSREEMAKQWIAKARSG